MMQGMTRSTLLCGICVMAVALMSRSVVRAQDHWEPLVPNLQIPGVSTLAYHPSGRLFLGFRDGRIGLLEDDTIRYADAGGNSFKIIRFQFAGDDTAYAWVDLGQYDMLRSVDGGATWHFVREPYSLWPPLVATGRGVVVSMVYDPGVKAPGIRSVTSGATWLSIDRAQFDSATFERCIDMVSGADGSIYAGFRGDSARNLYRSDDDGATWRPLSLAATYIDHIVATESGAILANARNPNVRGVFRSDDGGETWSMTLPLLPDASMISDISPAYSPGAGVIMVVVGAGEPRFWDVLRSTDDGRSWYEMPTAGLSDTLVLAVAAAPDGGIVSATLDNVHRFVEAPSSVRHKRDERYPDVRVEGDEIIVSLDPTIIGRARLDLYDIQARCVRTMETDAAGGSRATVRMNVHGLPSAPYILVMHAGEQIQVRPLALAR